MTKSEMIEIKFQKASLDLKDLLWSWLAEPHIQEFWDNSQEHKGDILNFMHGRKEPSTYANGQYIYWVAIENNQPYALIMCIRETQDSPINEIKLQNLSKTGNSYSLDFMIGNTDYLGNGFGAITLVRFMDFFRTLIDKKADLFIIDPAKNNSRAKHVYMKAGFEHVGDFIMEGSVSSAGEPCHLLVKRFKVD